MCPSLHYTPSGGPWSHFDGKTEGHQNNAFFDTFFAEIIENDPPKGRGSAYLVGTLVGPFLKALREFIFEVPGHPRRSIVEVRAPQKLPKWSPTWTLSGDLWELIFCCYV